MLIWSAIAINGWQKQQRCVELQKQIESVNTNHDRIVIRDKDLDTYTELQEFKKEVRPIQEFHDHLADAVLSQQAAKLDLASVSKELPVVARIPDFLFASIPDRKYRFKVRIPNNRSVAVKLSFSHGKDSPNNKTYLHPLPVGEYVLTVTRKDEYKPKTKLFAFELGIGNMQSPVKFDHETKFYPNIGQGRRSIRETQTIEPDASVLLLSSSHSNSVTNEFIDVSVSLVDKSDE